MRSALHRDIERAAQGAQDAPSAQPDPQPCASSAPADTASGYVRHTPGPWEAVLIRDLPDGDSHGGHREHWRIRSASKEVVEADDSNCWVDYPGEVWPVIAGPDAARIVACVNACEGINPEAVPDLIAALKEQLAESEAYEENGTLFDRKAGIK